MWEGVYFCDMEGGRRDEFFGDAYGHVNDKDIIKI